jgi:hypothetical protein
LDKQTQRRVEMPVLNDCVLSDGGSQPWFRFESNMTLEQHRAFNALLNKRVTETPPGAMKMAYKHTREIDELYAVAAGRKVRVTRDKTTQEVRRPLERRLNLIQVLAVIEKKKIANLHLFMPTMPFDCRISVNQEIAAVEPVNLEPFQVRSKDRLSYKHDVFQYDLTQVRTTTTTTQGEISHELEMEVRFALEKTGSDKQDIAR